MLASVLTFLAWHGALGRLPLHCSALALLPGGAWDPFPLSQPATPVGLLGLTCTQNSCGGSEAESDLNAAAFSACETPVSPVGGFLLGVKHPAAHFHPALSLLPPTSAYCPLSQQGLLKSHTRTCREGLFSAAGYQACNQNGCWRHTANPYHQISFCLPSPDFRCKGRCPWVGSGWVWYPSLPSPIWHIPFP